MGKVRCFVKFYQIRYIMEAIITLGNQLFPVKYYQKLSPRRVFMAEDYELCTYYKFHKHKIMMFLSAMRHFRELLEENNYLVDYHDIEKSGEILFEDKLTQYVKNNSINCLHMYEIEDKFMETRISQLCKTLNVALKYYPSPMFTCSRKEFAKYLSESKKPWMKSFYERQRLRLNIMIEDGKPTGGKFSFDSDNRKKLPKGHIVPPKYHYLLDSIDRDVLRVVDKLFKSHPGETKNYWLPTSQEKAQEQFKDFLKHRLKDFGPYQDAISSDEDFLHHSLIAPAINMGLLVPQDLVEETLLYASKNDIPISSVEGFVRQIIGWREFVRGIYQHYSSQMEKSNKWQSFRKLKQCWYEGNTGLPPLDDAIKRAHKNGYNHHIERLMILSNLMNLCEIEPREVYRWFMEMYVDSSDWVMAANVYGMGLMSDGGIFATKPYISGSNYILKMSHYKKGTWCDIWDGLYWRFVEKNFNFFQSNPRMKMMTRTLSLMKNERKNQIFTAAEKFLEKVTIL